MLKNKGGKNVYIYFQILQKLELKVLSDNKEGSKVNLVKILVKK